MMRPQCRVAGASHVGRRPHQEDAFLTLVTPRGAVVAVADGMGGHQAGEVASRLAVDALAQAVRQGGVGNGEEFLPSAAAAANAAILDYAAAQPQAEGLGTTLVAAVVTADEIIVGHAGDSRAWLVTGEEAIALTRDHSAVQEALDNGTLTAAEAATSPYRNAILRSLGDAGFPGLEIARVPIQGTRGAVVVLTSDGAHGWLTPTDLLDQVLGSASPDDAAERLVRLAYHRGADDNITVVACEVGRLPRSRVRSPAPPPLPATPKRRAQVPRAAIVLLAALLAVIAVLGVALLRTLRSPAVTPERAPLPAASPPVAPAPPAATGAVFATPIPGQGGLAPATVPARGRVTPLPDPPRRAEAGEDGAPAAVAATPTPTPEPVHDGVLVPVATYAPIRATATPTATPRPWRWRRAPAAIAPATPTAPAPAGRDPGGHP